MPFGARVRKELIKLPEVVFDELPNRVQGVVLSVELVLVGVTFSSAMSTPDMRIWKSLRLILLMFAIQMSFSRIDTGPTSPLSDCLAIPPTGVCTRSGEASHCRKPNGRRSASKAH